MPRAVSTLTVTEDVTLVSLGGLSTDMRFLAEVLDQFASSDISIDMISLSSPMSDRFDVSFTAAGGEFKAILSVVSALRADAPKLKISASGGCSKVTLSGEEMPFTCGVAYSAVKALSDCGVTVKLITTSETDISFLVSSADESAAVEAFREAFAL